MYNKYKFRCRNNNSSINYEYQNINNVKDRKTCVNEIKPIQKKDNESPELFNDTAKLKIAAIQASSVFMNKRKTTDKMLRLMEEARSNGANVCVFPETYLPGYPWWVVLESSPNMLYKKQDEAYSIYIKNSVTMDDDEVRMIVNKSNELGIFTIFGCVERSASGNSVYCTMVFVDPVKGIVNVHRKLMATFMERLIWTPGDGHGLKVTEYKGVKIGGLNCWENWMPLARFTLYAQGEEVHISIWPGLTFLLTDIPKFIAQEGKVYSIAVGGVLSIDDIPDDYVLKDEMRVHSKGKMLLDGGTCAYDPLGEELIAPIMNEEKIAYICINTDKVIEARRVFDPAGNYNSPYVFDLCVDTRRTEPLTKDCLVMECMKKDCHEKKY